MDGTVYFTCYLVLVMPAVHSGTLAECWLAHCAEGYNVVLVSADVQVAVQGTAPGGWGFFQIISCQVCIQA